MGVVVGQTFKAKFEQLDPQRKAGIIFGVDKMHRKFVASNGGVSGIPHDVAELLRDEPTIKAYLSIVQKEGDTDLYSRACLDAERARGRLAGSVKQANVSARTGDIGQSARQPEGRADGRGKRASYQGWVGLFRPRERNDGSPNSEPS
jgi:hypothetical protein